MNYDQTMKMQYIAIIAGALMLPLIAQGDTSAAPTAPAAPPAEAADPKAPAEATTPQIVECVKLLKQAAAALEIQQTYDRISECICFNTKEIKVVVELKNMPEFQNTQFTTTKIIVETHDFNCKYNGKLYRIASIDDVYSVDELIAPYLSEDNLDIVSFSPNDDDLMYFIISNHEGRKVLKEIVYFTLDELECSGG